MHLQASQARTFLIFMLPALAFLTLLFFYPVASMLATSVLDPQPGLQNYRLLFENPALARVFGTTLRIAAATTAIAVAVGYLIAYRMHQAGPRELRLILFCLVFPLWTSVLVRAFSWVMLLQRTGPINQLLMGLGLISHPLALARNELGVLIGMVHVMIPYATLPIYTAMTGLDARLPQAARSLGASTGQVFWRVFFPLTLPGVASAVIVVFITSLGFYVTPLVLGGGKVVMIAEYISIQINQTVRWGLGSMLATVLLAIVLLFVIGFQRLSVLRHQRT